MRACPSACRSSVDAGATTPCCASLAPSRSWTPRLLELGQQTGQCHQRVRDDVGERRLGPFARGGGPTGRGAAAPCASRRGAPGARRCRDGRRRRRCASGSTPATSATAAKNSADGFCAPSSSEIRIASTSSPIASSAARAWGGWLPAMITPRPACRSAAKHAANVAIQVVGVEVLAQAIGVVGTPAGQLARRRRDRGERCRRRPPWGRSRAAIAPSTPSIVSRVTPSRSAHRDQMRVSSISVSPTSNATAAIRSTGTGR